MQIGIQLCRTLHAENIVLSENGSTESRHRKVSWQEELRHRPAQERCSLSVQPPAKRRRKIGRSQRHEKHLPLEAGAALSAGPSVTGNKDDQFAAWATAPPSRS